MTTQLAACEQNLRCENRRELSCAFIRTVTVAVFQATACSSRFHLPRCQWQQHRKRAAFPERALHTDRAALQLDNSTGQRQPQSRAFVSARGAGFELFELGEEPAEVLRLDANARVRNRQLEAVRLLRGGGDVDASTVGRGF